MSDYSDTPGMNIKENIEDYIAIKSFFVYRREIEEKNGKDAAFILPKYFIDARRKFTRKEVQQIYNEVNK